MHLQQTYIDLVSPAYHLWQTGVFLYEPRIDAYDSMGSPLQEKSKAFALEIIKICNEIKQKKRESILTNQLVRSGTSIGANIREAFYAHGRADFIAKLQIALKECSESEYWLELLIESGYYGDRTILEQCIEVKKLLIASINTAKNNAN